MLKTVAKLAKIEISTRTKVLVMVSTMVLVMFCEVFLNRWPQHHPHPSGRHSQVVVMLRPTGAPLAVIFWAFLDLKTPKTRPFGSRNGSETAQERPEKRPSFGQAHGQRFS